mmetsp:Transcript_41366/g.54391  ORF Transcript_41366/g.54391 Transcript_41366/m.54391 type:complete len:230 (-) Transcript_41366:1562-2251(-)
MYLQIACTLSQEEVRERQVRSLFLGSAAAFIALFVLIYLDYMKKIQENDYVEWDIKTITAGDYTIEFDISPDFYNDFVIKESNNWVRGQLTAGKDYVSRVEAFRDWIQNEMERRLDQLPDLGYEDEPVEHVKVAVTTFAFKNHEIINLLKKRGSVIKEERWDDMVKIDEAINRLKNSCLEELTMPCSVFMTFDNEEGINRALGYADTIAEDESLSHLKTWLGDHELEIN